MNHRRAVLGVALACVLAIGDLAGCGGDDRRQAGPSNSVIVPGRPGEPNKTVPATKGTVAPPSAADIRFVQMMVPHHEQALEMAELAPDRAAEGKVRALADRVNAAQTGEIARMRSWLREHALRGHHGASAPPAHTTPGMATPRQIAQLEKAGGKDFDRLFLSLMITHHEGALTMANEELTTGSDVLIQEMAQEVVVTQTAEISRMRALLNG